MERYLNQGPRKSRFLLNVVDRRTDICFYRVALLLKISFQITVQINFDFFSGLLKQISSPLLGSKRSSRESMLIRKASKTLPRGFTLGPGSESSGIVYFCTLFIIVQGCCCYIDYSVLMYRDDIQLEDVMECFQYELHALSSNRYLALDARPAFPSELTHYY